MNGDTRSGWQYYLLMLLSLYKLLVPVGQGLKDESETKINYESLRGVMITRSAGEGTKVRRSSSFPFSTNSFVVKSGQPMGDGNAKTLIAASSPGNFHLWAIKALNHLLIDYRWISFVSFHLQTDEGRYLLEIALS